MILTIGDMEGKTVIQFPISVSSTPAGTDESIAEFLVSLEENSPHVGKNFSRVHWQEPVMSLLTG